MITIYGCSTRRPAPPTAPDPGRACRSSAPPFSLGGQAVRRIHDRRQQPPLDLADAGTRSRLVVDEIAGSALAGVNDGGEGGLLGSQAERRQVRGRGAHEGVGLLTGGCAGTREGRLK